MSMMVSFVLSFFPRDVLDEILKLIESVSEDFPSYSCNYRYYLSYIHYLIKFNVTLHLLNVTSTLILSVKCDDVNSDIIRFLSYR